MIHDNDAERSRAQVARFEPAGRQGLTARATGYAGQDEVIAGDDGHLLDYVKVVYKRRSGALTAFVLIFGGVTAYTFTATPIYEARTRILIEADTPNVVSFKQVIDEDQTKIDYYQTQYNILQSRALARKTMDALKLWEHPMYGAAGENQALSFRTAVAGVVGAVGDVFQSDDARAAREAAAADETLAQSRALDTFLAGLTVSPIRSSRLVDVKYRLSDAALATAIVNALAKNYIEQNLEYKFMASKEASDWLGERLAEQRKQVEQAEAKLQQYREQNDAISLEDRQNIVVQKLADLNAAVTRAKTERIQKEAMYNQLRASQSNPASLDTFPAILTNTFIQQQKSEVASLTSKLAQASERLGEKHPEIVQLQTAIKTAQAKLQGEIGKVVQSVRIEYQAALAQEQSLTSALNQQKNEALSMNRKAINYGVLERDVESSKQLYESLLQRAKETGVSTELRTSNIRIVDAAERPHRPASPRRGLNLLMGLAAGSLLGVGLAFFFEYLDNRIKTPDEIKLHLGLPSLGMLPAVSAKALEERYPLVSNGVPPNFSEAFRAVRTNVLFSSAQEGSKTLLVTSTGPGEGKTMVACNMAVSLAQTGQRVLLIDADMRRPKVHDVFGQRQEPGLSNLLVGNAKASESIRRGSIPGLWLLSSGKNPPNPAELLGSQRFEEFMRSLGEHFDWVVVDSPPVMAVTDASVIAHKTTGVVFVVGAEMTSRQAAQTAVEQLESARARFIGAVLNRVDLQRNSYYYHRYYRREYGEYYTQSTSVGDGTRG
jgi:capsular exopolysaccharide synthesis family protein